MRVWFSAPALYVPLWIVAGTLMGLWGTGMSIPVGILWIIVGVVIAAVAWRASANQVREGNLIKEHLGKLVSVTEPSPANVLAAVGAKILTLDHARTELAAKVEELQNELDQTKAQQRRELSPTQRSALKAAIEAIQAQHGADSLRFPIFYNYMVGEAGEYAGQLNEVLFSCGVSYGVPTSTNEIPLNFQGLALWVQNEQTPPQRARLFMSALQSAGLPVRFETLTGRRAAHIKEEHCEFIVGRRESIGEIERQLTKLKADYDARWQSLSDRQRTDFVATLREFKIEKLGGGPSVIIFPDFTHHDAVELSHTITQLCRDAAWYGGTYGNATQKVDCPPGLTIYAKAERADVQTFARALERAHIPYEQTVPANHVDIFEIRIGRRIR